MRIPADVREHAAKVLEAAADDLRNGSDFPLRWFGYSVAEGLHGTSYELAAEHATREVDVDPFVEGPAEPAPRGGRRVGLMLDVLISEMGGALAPVALPFFRPAVTAADRRWQYLALKATRFIQAHQPGGLGRMDPMIDGIDFDWLRSERDDLSGVRGFAPYNRETMWREDEAINKGRGRAVERRLVWHEDSDGTGSAEAAKRLIIGGSAMRIHGSVWPNRRTAKDPENPPWVACVWMVIALAARPSEPSTTLPDTIEYVILRAKASTKIEALRMVEETIETHCGPAWVSIEDLASVSTSDATTGNDAAETVELELAPTPAAAVKQIEGANKAAMQINNAAFRTWASDATWWFVHNVEYQDEGAELVYAADEVQAVKLSGLVSEDMADEAVTTGFIRATKATLPVVAKRFARFEGEDRKRELRALVDLVMAAVYEAALGGALGVAK